MCLFSPPKFIIPQAGTETLTEDLLNSYADMWSFLGEEQTASLRKGGFYSKLIEPGLRYVGLNSQYGDMINFWLYATGGDTGGPNQVRVAQCSLSSFLCCSLCKKKKDCLV